MIYGVTVDKETNQPIQRLAIVGKVGIGEVISTPCKGHAGPTCKKCGGSGRTTRPSKLDHFKFSRKDEQTHDWVPDKELQERYGKDCRSVWIVLLDDDIDAVFRTEMAWWNQTQCVCHGDGLQAIRRTQEHPEGQPWTPCGEGCPDLGPGRPCKPNGVLHFMLADVPKLGGVWKFDTTGYRSIRQIHSSLIQLQNIFGRLAGIRCQLVVRPEKTTYTGTDKKKHTSTIYAVSIEIPARDVRALVSEATGPATAFEASRKALGAGRVEYVEPTEPERASELQPEFYPETEAAPEPPPKEPKRKSERKGKKAAPAEVVEPVSDNRTTVEPGQPLKVRGKLELCESCTGAHNTEGRKLRIAGHLRTLFGYDNYKLSLIHDPKTGERVQEQVVTLFALLDGSVGLEVEMMYMVTPSAADPTKDYHKFSRITRCGHAEWDDEGLPVIRREPAGPWARQPGEEGPEPLPGKEPFKAGDEDLPPSLFK